MKYIATAILRVVGWIALFYTMQFLLQFIVIAVYAAWQGLTHGPSNIESGSDLMEEALINYFAHCSILSAVLTIVALFAIQSFRRERWDRTWLPNGLSIGDIALILALACSFNVFLQSAISVIGLKQTLPENLEWILKESAERHFTLTFIAFGITAPILEELLFRGVIFTELQRVIPSPFALVVQALLFGLVHLFWVQVIYAALLGVLLGLAYVWLRSIWAPILMHLTFNCFSILLPPLHFTPETMSPKELTPYIFGCGCLALVVFLALYLRRLPAHSYRWTTAYQSERNKSIHTANSI